CCVAWLPRCCVWCLSRLVRRRCCCRFFFQAEDGIRDFHVTGVQTCALPIFASTDRPAIRSAVHAFNAPAASNQISSHALSERMIAYCARYRGNDKAPSARETEIGRASCRERVASARGEGALTQQRGERHDEK